MRVDQQVKAGGRFAPQLEALTLPVISTDNEGDSVGDQTGIEWGVLRNYLFYKRF